jgi:hypothetical protein
MFSQSQLTSLAYAFVRKRTNIQTSFWWKNTKKKVGLKDPGVDERIILKWMFKEPE